MTTYSNGFENVVANLSEAFGIEWDPDVMAYEESHLFRSTNALSKERADAEQ